MASNASSDGSNGEKSLRQAGTKVYGALKHLPLWGIGGIYALFSTLYLIIKLFPISEESRLAQSLFDWQSCFHPLQAFLAKARALISSSDVTTPVSLAHLAQISWSWLVLYVLLDLVAIVTLAAGINVIAQKLFELPSRFTQVLRKLFVINIIVSLVFLAPLFAFASNAVQTFIFAGLVASVWLVIELKSVYQTDVKHAGLIFLVAIPLFPFAALLLIVYAFFEVPGLRRYASPVERHIRTWLELLHTPTKAFYQIPNGYSTLAAFALAAVFGAFGIYLLSRWAFVAQLYPSYEPLWWGFSALFHKTELAAIAVMHNFDLGLKEFSNFSLPAGRFFYLYLSFLLSLLIQVGLIDFTTWTLHKENKHFGLTLNFVSLLIAMSMLLFVIFVGLAFLVLKLSSVSAGQGNLPLADLQVAPELFKGLAVTAAVFCGLWLVTMQIRSFKVIYGFDNARSILLWLTSLVFLPISLLIVLWNALLEVAGYLMAPLRTRILQSDAVKLRAIDEATPPDRINHTIDSFIQHLTDRNGYNVIARRRLEINPALENVIRHQPKVMINNLLKLAEDRNPDLRQDALRWLAGLFTGPAPSHTRLFYYMLEGRISTPNVGRMAQQLHNHPIWPELLQGYHELLGESAFGEQHQKLLFNISALFRQLEGDAQAREFASIYSILGTLAQLRSIREITRLDELIKQHLKLEGLQETQMLEIFKLFLRLNSYQALYERVEKENKQPFLSAQLAIIVEIQRELDSLKYRELERRILKAYTTKIQEWAMAQIRQHRGEIKLVFSLKTQSIPLSEGESTIVVNLRNEGSGLAQNLKLTLVPQPEDRDRYVLAGTATQTTPLLESKESKDFEFMILPLQACAQRLLFRVDYADIENRVMALEYGDVLQFTTMTITDTTDQQVGDVINPYIAGTAVAEPRMFFGRQGEFDSIRANLQGRYQDNIIVVHGQRRTGKSSILLQAENHLGPDHYVGVYIDLQSFTSAGMPDFLHRMATLICRELDKKGIALARPALPDFSRDPGTYFSEEFLSSVFARIGGRKLLLLLDEFEELEMRVKEGKLNREIFAYLRSLMQHAQRLSFILAGAHRLHEMSSEYWSMLFNITRYVKVGFLDKASSERLICEPVAQHVTYDPLAIEKIYRVTSGQPYFIQLICHELFNKYKRDRKNYLTIQDVNQAMQQIIEAGSGHLDYIWNMATPYERIVLAAVADAAAYDGERVTLSGIGNRLKSLYFSYEEKTVRESLNHLVDIEILQSDANFDNFTFRVDLMGHWLREARPLGKAIEEYKTLRR